MSIKIQAKYFSKLFGYYIVAFYYYYYYNAHLHRHCVLSGNKINFA